MTENKVTLDMTIDTFRGGGCNCLTCNVILSVNNIINKIVSLLRSYITSEMVKLPSHY